MSNTIPILLHRMRQMEALDHTAVPSWSWLWSSDVKATQPEGAGTKSPGADAESAEKRLPAEGERADQSHKYALQLQEIAQDSEEDYKKVWMFWRYVAEKEKSIFTDEKTFLLKLKLLDQNMYDIMFALREGQNPEKVSLWSIQTAIMDMFQQMIQLKTLFTDKRKEQMQYITSLGNISARLEQYTDYRDVNIHSRK